MNKKLVLVASDSKATMTKAAIVSFVVVVAARVSNYTQETRRNETKNTQICMYIYIKKLETEPSKKLVSDEASL